jgi:hypothetical protein
MNTMRRLFSLIAVFSLWASVTASDPLRLRDARVGPATPSSLYLPFIRKPIAAPVLKWQRGGCYASWCETGWYSSPAVADLDGNGSAEVIAASYSIVILNGATGALVQRLAPQGGSQSRAWPGVVVADLDGNGTKEIVTAHGDGYLNVFNNDGTLRWTRQPTPGDELRGLAVYDLDNDGQLEIIVSAAAARNDNQWYVYDRNGNLRSGWPQLAPGAPGNAAGAYNENIGVADLDADNHGEIIGPSDVHYITAYQDNGAQIAANSRYGAGKVWSEVGVHVGDAVDLRGYANCDNPPHPPLEPRPNFANTAPTLADVNGDGSLEVIVVGNNYDCRTDPYTDLYYMPFIFNPDRSRWSGNGFDWTAIPTPDSAAAPLTEDYNVIENVLPNPVVVDLDGDGFKEILFASYDGRLHADWLDKTEHGAWPYRVYNPAEGVYRFASEPVVADLDNDGKAEVLFTSWVQKGTNLTGRLTMLDYQGNVLYNVDLPPAVSGDWNGGLGAPTLANIDSDPDLEIVVNTAASGVVAYDLPGTANARVLWRTGRGNYQRTGSMLPGGP